MKIFLAGATGAIGRPLVAQLLRNNHEVTAMTRSTERVRELKENGVDAVFCDVFDRESLQRHVQAAQPDVVIHQLTALPRRIDPRKIKTQLAATNRLRTEGTENLVEAAELAGAKRFIAQSIAFAYAPIGTKPQTEVCPLYEKAPPFFRELIDAVGRLEEITLSNKNLAGVALRYGFFYGPGTAYAPDGSFAEDVLARRVPIMGNGAGTFSFIHVEDAAAATVAALESGATGVYNIVDDTPAPVAEWLPYYAKILGAPAPRRLPRWLARLFAGSYADYLMCAQSGASNAKAKRELNWTPRYATWQSGFDEMLGRRDCCKEHVAESGAA